MLYDIHYVRMNIIKRIKNSILNILEYSIKKKRSDVLIRKYGSIFHYCKINKENELKSGDKLQVASFEGLLWEVI